MSALPSARGCLPQALLTPPKCPASRTPQARRRAQRHPQESRLLPSWAQARGGCRAHAIPLPTREDTHRGTCVYKHTQMYAHAHTHTHPSPQGPLPAYVTRAISQEHNIEDGQEEARLTWATHSEPVVGSSCAVGGSSWASGSQESWVCPPGCQPKGHLAAGGKHPGLVGSGHCLSPVTPTPSSPHSPAQLPG